MKRQNDYSLDVPASDNICSHKSRIVQREWIRPANVRLCVTSLVVVLYVGWAMLSFIIFVRTGNSLLLLSLSTFSYPLHRVVDYYFGTMKKGEEQ